MNLQNWIKQAIIFYVFGVIQVIILSIFAMLFYTGGTRIDKYAPGYTFWMNYISDLGRTIAFSGVPNTISQILFVIMEFIWSIAFILLFITFASLFTEMQKNKWINIAGAIFAIISGIVLIGAILAPEDIYPELHMLLAVAYYLTIALAAIFYAIIIYLEKILSKKYAYSLLILVIFVLIYAIICLIGLNFPLTPESLVVYVVGQKIITYTLLAATCALSYGMWKFSNLSRSYKNLQLKFL